MSHRHIAAALATIVATVALPATAVAKPSVSASSDKAKVTVHVAKADAAIKRLNRAARIGNVRQVESQLKIARSQVSAASKLARKLSGNATTNAQEMAAAHALTLVGTEYDDLLESITAIVDQVTGLVQAKVANSIVPTIAGKDRLVSLLTSLVPEVPVSAQGTLASIIAGLSVADATEIVNLDQALQSGNLPLNISAIVTQALSMATSVMSGDFAMFQTLVTTLPGGAQGPITLILTTVQGSTGALVPAVLSTVTGLIHSILGSIPLAGGPSATGSLGGLGGLLTGILGGTGSSLPGNAGGILEGLLDELLGGGLGGVTGGVTGGGASPVGGIVTTVTNLVNSLLGGVLPGVLPAT